MLVAAIALGWLINVAPLESLVNSTLRENLVATAVGLALGTLMFVAAVGVSFLPWERVRQFDRFMEQQVTPLFAELSVLQLALIALLAGWGEEALFRGLLQQGIARGIGEPLGWICGAIIASLAFGVCHALNKTYLVLATIMGFGFAALLILFDHLAVCIACHAWYDFLMLLFLVRGSRSNREASE